MKLFNNKISVLCALAIAIALPSTFSHAHNNGTRHSHQRDDLRQGQARQTITLNREDLRSLNQRGQIGLKRALKNKVGNRVAINKNTKLVSVNVYGRATGGMSLVSLKVNGSIVDEAFLANRRCNRNRGERCRQQRGNSITLHNSSPRNSQGAWKLLTDIDTRVNKVEVTIRQKRVNRLTQISLGSAKITKVIGRTKQFRVSNYRVKSITLKAKSNSLDILDVVVNYRDGSYKVIRRLSGQIRQNRTKTVNLPESRKSVSSISVEAVSDNIIGSSGRLEVLIGVQGPEPRPRPRPRRRN